MVAEQRFCFMACTAVQNPVLPQHEDSTALCLRSTPAAEDRRSLVDRLQQEMRLLIDELKFVLKRLLEDPLAVTIADPVFAP